MSRIAHAPAPTISLFPFLAVLLCTMGALLVLLVIFSNSARQQTRSGPAAADLEAERELETARDTLAWRVEQLDRMRERTLADLAAARMQLAGIEENGRGLADELAGLERQSAALTAGARSDADAARIDAELAERLRSARESRDEAIAEKQSRPPAYAVVPYKGASSTHRRPLYIECCGDGVFLQPEGIRLNPADFAGPPGPGNPLASALRAAREHIVAIHGGAGDPGRQPYPLLLVRPSGVIAYYAARESIQSWGSDFGYQLVDEDWTLAFPPADPALAQVERRAIDEARQRLAWLAEVRPVRQPRQPQQYRAAPTRGGVVVDGGPSVLGDQSRWDFASGGRGDGGGGGPAGGGSGDGGLAGGSGRGASGGAGGGPGVGFGSPGRGGAGTAGGRGMVAGKLAPSGNGPAGQAGEAGSSLGTAGVPGGTASGNGAAARDGGDDPAAARIASAGQRAGGGPTGSGTGGGGAAGASSGASATAAAGAVSTNGSGGTGGGSGGNVSGSPPLPGLVGGGGSPGAAGSSSASASVSLAQSRGRDWASLASRDRPVGLTRPVRIECARDEFRLLDDSGRRVETRVAIDGDTAAAVDPLVRAVHQRVEHWGIAGERMYWRPQLVLSETADGRGRRQDLERLLADSGIDTRSVEVGDRIVPLPPVERSTAAAPQR